MKAIVHKTIEEEVDIELPLYGSWFSDVDDGRLSWDTWFRIDDSLCFTTVSEYSDGRYEMSVQKLEPREVGQYLKHCGDDASEFHAAMSKAKAIFYRE